MTVLTAPKAPMQAGLAGEDDAASFLACSVAAIRKWGAQHRLPRVKVGRLTRYRWSDLARIAAEGLPEAAARARRT